MNELSVPISALEKAQQGLKDGSLTINDAGKLVPTEEEGGEYRRVPNRTIKRAWMRGVGQRKPQRSRCRRVRNRIRREKFS